MRIPNLTRLLPQPHQLVDLTKRVSELLPGRARRSSEEAVVPLPTPPKSKAKSRPKAKAAAKPRAKAAAKPKPAKAKQKPKKPGPHHALNIPVGEPDPTEWPDPYDKREDPRDPPDPDGMPFGEDPHPATGGRSTSEPHPSQDPAVAELREKYDRDKLDQ